MEIEFTNEPKLKAKLAGYLWWKKVVVGGQFRQLTDHMREAIIAHETGHAKLWHPEIRILMGLLLFIPGGWKVIKWLCKNQEFAADAYAFKIGKGGDLIDILLLGIENPSGKFHPSNRERIERLKRLDYRASVYRK